MGRGGQRGEPRPLRTKRASQMQARRTTAAEAHAAPTPGASEEKATGVRTWAPAPPAAGNRAGARGTCWDLATRALATAAQRAAGTHASTGLARLLLPGQTPEQLPARQPHVILGVQGRH